MNNREIILKKLENKKLNAKEIHNGTTMNITTVYRILEKLKKENQITSSIGNDQIVYYEIHHPHNHYLVCKVCNVEEVIQKCYFGNAEELVLNETGFKVTNHEKIYGICRECLK
ncbi:MAG: transcriptional repressor [bacterium]